MTTTAQQTVLSTEELECLAAIDSRTGQPPTTAIDALAAKGMLAEGPDGAYRLTPAGRLAIHMPGPGDVPGIDN